MNDVSLSLWSNAVMPLFLCPFERYMLPALKSPVIKIAVGFKVCAILTLSVKLSKKSSSRSDVKFGGRYMQHMMRVVFPEVILHQIHSSSPISSCGRRVMGKDELA